MTMTPDVPILHGHSGCLHLEACLLVDSATFSWVEVLELLGQGQAPPQP